MIDGIFGRRGALRRMLGLGVGAAAIGSGAVGTGGPAGIGAQLGVPPSAGYNVPQVFMQSGEAKSARMSPEASALNKTIRAADRMLSGRATFRDQDGFDPDIASLRLPRATKARMQIKRNVEAEDWRAGLTTAFRRAMGWKIADED